MNSKTKIIVLSRRELLIGIIAVVLLILLLIFTAGTFANKKNPAQNTSSYINAKSVSGVAASNYTPGVYGACISLNGNSVDIEVTVDKNNIKSIELVNLPQDITAMYPSFENTFSELSASVIASGSAKNITYQADNKYTSVMILNAIQSALDKCTIQ